MQDLKYISEQAKTERLVKEKARKEAENNASINENTGIVTNEATVPNQSVNPVYDENTPYITPAPVAEQPVVAPVVEPLSRADQLMQQFYATREQAPVHDQAKEDRLKKMGKINMIGRGIGVLGDVLTMGLGGNVRRSQPDRVQPMLYQQYQALMDKEKADQDSYKFRSFQNERANIGMQLSEEHRKEAEKFRNAQINAKTATEKLKADNDWAKFLATYKQRGEQYNATNANNKERNRIGLINATKPNATEEKLTRPVTIATAKKSYKLAPEEASFYRGEAIKNSKLLMDKYPTWFVNETDRFGDAIPGRYKLDSHIKDQELIRAQLELIEEQEAGKGMAKAQPSTQGANGFEPYYRPQYTGPGTQTQAPAQQAAQPAAKQKQLSDFDKYKKVK